MQITLSGDRSDDLTKTNYVKSLIQRGDQQGLTSMHQTKVFSFNNEFGHRMFSMENYGIQLGVRQLGVAHPSTNM